MRFDDQTWQAMKHAAGEAKTNVNAVTRDFYAWYTHKAGAALPKRPPRP